MHILLTFALFAGIARGQTCTLQLGGITYRVPRLSDRGFHLRAGVAGVSELIAADRQVRSIGEPFRLDGLTRAYRPLQTFAVRDRETFSRPGAVSVLDLMIKSPGLDYAVPEELAQFRELLQRLVDFEHAINPRASADYYAYLTVDQSLVPAGQSQRQGGFQLDGFQGVERVPKEEIDHSYIVADALPEVFTSQRFHFGGFDYALHNVFSELDRQARPEFELRGQPYQVNLANAYTAHRSPVSDFDQPRTFLRLTFSRARFDKLGATENPMLPYSWTRVEKTLRRSLARYVPGVGLHLLPEVRSLENVRGARLGLVTLGGADARVAAHVAEILIAAGRDVQFVASVRPALTYRGGRALDADLIHVDETFRPFHPIAESAFAVRLPTYLVLQHGDLRGALRDLVDEHQVDGLVLVDVGGAALAPVFGQEMPLIEHRLRDAVDTQARGAVAHRTLVIAAPGFGLPPDATLALSSRARRYRPTLADQRRVEVSAATWDQVAPAPSRREVAAQMWRQALAQRFGIQAFPPLNDLDPPLEVKPEHQDLLILPLDDVQTSSVRWIR